MAKQKKPPLTNHIFVNGRPLKDYSPEERAEIGRKATQRMGEVLNSRFSQNPEMYIRVCKSYDAKKQAAAC